jgi:HEAT repeat protein
VGSSRDRQFFLQAQAAVAESNWSQASYALQEFFESSQAPLPSPDPAGEKSQATELNPVLDLCLQILENGDFSDRWNLVKIIPKLGEGVLDSLIVLLRSTADPDVRWFTMRIIGKFRHPIVIEILLESLFLIEDLSWTDNDEDKDPENQDWQSLAIDIIGEFGTSAIAPLSKLMVEEQTRLVAVLSLSRIASEEVVTPLLEVVNDPHPEIREIAIRVVGLYPDPRIPSVLLQALQDQDDGVRVEAIRGLGWRQNLHESYALVEHLIPLLADKNLLVACQAATALGRLGSLKAVKALGESVASSHSPFQLHRNCLQALGQISTPEALIYLQKCMSLENQDILLETIRVLGSLTPPLADAAAAALIEFAMAHPTPVQYYELECGLAQALGQLKAVNAVQPLIQLLKSPDLKTRLHIIAALKKIDSQLAQQLLTELASQTNLSSDLKAGIAIALQEWPSSSTSTL